MVSPDDTDHPTIVAPRKGCSGASPTSCLEYSLWTRDPEDLLPTLRELGIGLVADSPLGARLPEQCDDHDGREHHDRVDTCSPLVPIVAGRSCGIMTYMADVVERTVRVLHQLHDELVDLAGRLGEAEARAQSYCDEWSVAQVFSHLGSGAEIGREELSAALAGEDPPAREDIWARWDALEPADMVREFAPSDARYLRFIGSTPRSVVRGL